jgi:hypothetical protein
VKSVQKGRDMRALKLEADEIQGSEEKKDREQNAPVWET